MTKFVPASPTSLGTWLLCPRQFDAKYISKTVVFQPSDASRFGDRAHKAIEYRLKQGLDLPSEFTHLEPMCAAVMRAPGTKLVEHNLPMTREFTACEWYSRYCGGKADFVNINGTDAGVFDWKTGKVKEDMLQLNMLTMGVFAHFPQVQRVRANLVFIQSNETPGFTAQRERFQVPDLIRDLKAYEASQAAGDYPATRNGLCRAWCDVLTCEHNGKRAI